MFKYIFLYICVAFASLGGMLSGYDTGVISGALLYINQSFSPSPELQGFLVSSVSLGAILGALINGFIADSLGRKQTLIICGLIFLFGSIFCSVSPNMTILIISRMFTGFALGIASFACPLYLSEISPKEKRGQNVSFYQLAITFGILFSYFTNYFCANSDSNWRIMLFIGAIPAFILLIGMIKLKDTPRWLIMRGRIKEAKRVLNLINKDIDIEKEIETIKQTLNIKKTNFSKNLIKPFIIGIGIMFCQIATGINAIIYYAPTIFRNLGFSSNKEVLFFTIFIGLINFLMTFVAIALVDKLGRKPLLYIGLMGMTLSLVMMSGAYVFDYSFIKYIALFASATYIVSFSMSLGPVALILISEIFPLDFRASAMSISIVANFIFNFIVSWLFPIALYKIGGFFTFLIFIAICIFAIAFIYFFVPETKGKSLEEIEKEFRI